MRHFRFLVLLASLCGCSGHGCGKTGWVDGYCNDNGSCNSPNLAPRETPLGCICEVK